MNEDMFVSRTKANVGQAQAANATHLNQSVQGQSKKHKVSAPGLGSKAKKDPSESEG